jgi:hypothetical protein
MTNPGKKLSQLFTKAVTHHHFIIFEKKFLTMCFRNCITKLKKINNENIKLPDSHADTDYQLCIVF